MDFRVFQHNRQGPRREQMDVETLTMVAEAIKASPLAASNRRISKMTAALDVCLRQQERLLATSSEFASKEAIMRDVVVARALCDKITAEMQCQSDSSPVPTTTSQPAA